MNTNKVLRRLRELGASIVRVKGTGEIRISHPVSSKVVTINGRRKDAPRSLTVLLKRAEGGEQ